MNAAERVCSPSRFWSRFGSRRAALKTSAWGPTPKYAPRALVRSRPEASAAERCRRRRRARRRIPRLPPRLPAAAASDPLALLQEPAGFLRQPGGRRADARSTDSASRPARASERPLVPEAGVLALLQTGHGSRRSGTGCRRVRSPTSSAARSPPHSACPGSAGSPAGRGRSSCSARAFAASESMRTLGLAGERLRLA
jgi:hypothetical protein